MNIRLKKISKTRFKLDELHETRWKQPLRQRRANGIDFSEGTAVWKVCYRAMCNVYLSEINGGIDPIGLGDGALTDRDARRHSPNGSETS